MSACSLTHCCRHTNRCVPDTSPLPLGSLNPHIHPMQAHVPDMRMHTPDDLYSIELHMCQACTGPIAISCVQSNLRHLTPASAAAWPQPQRSLPAPHPCAALPPAPAHMQGTVINKGCISHKLHSMPANTLPSSSRAADEPEMGSGVYSCMDAASNLGYKHLCRSRTGKESRLKFLCHGILPCAVAGGSAAVWWPSAAGFASKRWLLAREQLAQPGSRSWWLQM
ncbi:hypothetical protein V8C86DRAFT_563127 [Haematococcus lacustris]